MDEFPGPEDGCACETDGSDPEAVPGFEDGDGEGDGARGD